MKLVSRNGLVTGARKLSPLFLSCTVLTCAEAAEPPPDAAPPADAAGAQAIGVQEVIVTSQKRSENIQSVPLSIVAVSGDTLTENGVLTPLDLGKVVPSLKVFNAQISSGIQFRIRGFGTAANSATDSDVASYIDGAFVPRPGAILGAFLDVWNVEVLSGPQGTLFGRNAAMGAVSINTVAPSATRSLETSVEGASFGTYKASVIGNMPLSKDVAVRAALQVAHTDGVFHNNFDGKTYGDNTTYVGRLSAKWNISNDASWLVRVDGSNTRGDGVNAIGVYTRTASPAQLAALSNFATSNGGSAPVLSSEPSYTVNQLVGNPYDHDQQFGVTSELSWDIAPSLSLRLIDSYRNWDNDSSYPEAPATTLDLTHAAQATTSKSNSHELQLISAKDAFLGGRAGITSGLYYFHEDYDIDVTYNIGNNFCSALYGAAAPALVAPCQAGPHADAAFAPFAQSTDSYALYAQTNIALWPTVQLDLGGRESWERKSGTLSQFANNPVAFGRLVAPEGPDALSFTDRKPSLRASLSWNATQRIMPFVTYSTGYKAGGFNSGTAGAALGSERRTFQSETVKNIELGVKSSFLDQRLVLNATLFNTQLSNFQDRSFDGFSFLVRNAGDVRSRGADISGNIVALPNLSFDFGTTYLDSIYTRNTNAPGLEGCVAKPGTSLPANPSCPLVQDLSGQRLPYAPNWQGHVGLNWKLGRVKDHALAVTLGENFSSSYGTSSTNNPQARLPGFATTDLRLAVSSPDNKWKVELFGTNIFDKHYYVATVAQPLGGLMPGVSDPNTGATVFRGFLGDPARYGVRLSASY